MIDPDAIYRLVDTLVSPWVILALSAANVVLIFWIRRRWRLWSLWILLLACLQAAAVFGTFALNPFLNPLLVRAGGRVAVFLLVLGLAVHLITLVRHIRSQDK